MKAYCVGLSFLLLASVVQAEATETFVYVGAGAGLAHTNLVSKAYEGIDGTLSQAPQASLGLKAYGGVGLRFGPSVALEVGLHHLGTYRAQGTFWSGGTFEDKLSAQAYSLSLATRYALTQKLSLLARVGGASVKTRFVCVEDCSAKREWSQSSTAPLVGIGVSWQLSPQLALRADYDRFFRVKWIDGDGHTALTYSLGSFNLGVDYQF